MKKLVRTEELTQHEVRMAEIHEQNQQRLDFMESQKPVPLEFIEHTDDAPKELVPGVVVMPGDFYTQAATPLIVHKADIGEHGAWEEA